MKRTICRLTPALAVVCCAFAATPSALADTYYVSPYGTHQSPFDTWEKAATNIQDAVGLAGGGDTVLVTNGVYSTGGAVTPDYALTNRVVVLSTSVQSVNGPDVTVIVGSGPCGDGAVRCAYLNSNACLVRVYPFQRRNTIHKRRRTT